MIAAEVMEWPMTSPTTRATRLPGSGIASYQSPPTRAVSAAGQVAGGEPYARWAGAGSRAASCAGARPRCTPHGRTAPPCRCRGRVCVASWAATSRSFGSKAARSGLRRNTAAPITRRRPRSGARIARCRRRHGAVGAEQLGQRGTGGGGVAEDGPYAAQHLVQRAARAAPRTARRRDQSDCGSRTGSCGVGGRQREAARCLGVLVGQPIRSVRRSRSTTGPTGRSSPTGSGSRR